MACDSVKSGVVADVMAGVGVNMANGTSPGSVNL